MDLVIEDAGLQTTIQAGPRLGLRHKGVPAGGAADPLSLALANRLVGNLPGTPGLEITLSGASIEFTRDVAIALAGGEASKAFGEHNVPDHQTLFAKAGDRLTLGPVSPGCRVYLACAGGFIADDWLGSASTYLPATLGGFQGRALRSGDTLKLHPAPAPPESHTPKALRPHIAGGWALRYVPGPEANLLTEPSSAHFTGETYQVSQRIDRMGAALTGPHLELSSGGRLPSAPVFPGTVQCPPGGQPFLLLAEAQTTGGYPRIAQVIRADRHMLGQLRPGDRVRFIRTSSESATDTLLQKTALLRPWLGDTFELR